MGWSAASRTQACQMRGERGGTQAGVAEVVLNEGEGDARFEEMRGVAVTVRMHMGARVHAALFDGADKGALQRGTGDGCGVDTRGGGEWTAVAPHRGKEPERMAVRAPVRAQERERGVRKRHRAILAALAVEVERRAIAVDVRHPASGCLPSGAGRTRRSS